MKDPLTLDQPTPLPPAAADPGPSRTAAGGPTACANGRRSRGYPTLVRRADGRGHPGGRAQPRHRGAHRRWSRPLRQSQRHALRLLGRGARLAPLVRAPPRGAPRQPGRNRRLPRRSALSVAAARPLAANTVRLLNAGIPTRTPWAASRPPAAPPMLAKSLPASLGRRSSAGKARAPKRAARVATLREIVPATGYDLRAVPDGALLLLGVALAFGRAEPAGIRVARPHETEQRLRVSLSVSKGDRATQGTVVGIPKGSSGPSRARAAAMPAAAGVAAIKPPENDLYT